MRDEIDFTGAVPNPYANPVKQTLRLVRGLPGSGKTEYAKKMRAYLHLETDQSQVRNGVYEWREDHLQRSHAFCIMACESSLSMGRSVVVSNTFTRNWEMMPYVEMAKYFKVKVEIIERHGNYGSVKGIPPDKYELFASRWEELNDELEKYRR